MSNVHELELSKSEVYKDVLITAVYDHKQKNWMYGFNLADITQAQFNSFVFGHTDTPDEGFTRAKGRIDRMIEAYNRNPNGHDSNNSNGHNTDD